MLLLPRMTVVTPELKESVSNYRGFIGITVTTMDDDEEEFADSDVEPDESILFDEEFKKAVHAAFSDLYQKINTLPEGKFWE